MSRRSAETFCSRSLFGFVCGSLGAKEYFRRAGLVQRDFTASIGTAYPGSRMGSPREITICCDLSLGSPIQGRSRRTRVRNRSKGNRPTNRPFMPLGFDMPANIRKKFLGADTLHSDYLATPKSMASRRFPAKTPSSRGKARSDSNCLPNNRAESCSADPPVWMPKLLRDHSLGSGG